MTGPLTPSASTDLVVNCPECHRTIWAGTLCRHGELPPPEDKSPAPENTGPVPVVPNKEEVRRGR